MRVLLRLLILLAVSSMASADTGMHFPTPTAAAPGTFAHDLYVGLFGQWGNSPWTQVGLSNSLLGELFFSLNVFVFSLAVCWSSWTATTAVVQTAHDGDVFGKRYSTVWLPVRMVAGMGSLVPAWSGYSAAQAIMMSAALLGNSVADEEYKVVVRYLSAGGAIVSPVDGAVTTMGAGGSASSLVEQMFLSSACVAYHNAAADASSVPGMLPSPRYSRTTMTATDGSDTLIVYGSLTRDTLGNFFTECGKVSIRRPKRSSAHTTSNAVNYDAIAAQTFASTTSVVQNFSAQIDAIAKAWVDATFQSWTANGNDWVALPTFDSLQSQLVAQLASARQQAFTSGIPAITSDAQANMQRGGWMSMGAWYQTMAMETDAVREASSALFGYTAPTGLNDTFSQDLQAALVRTYNSTSQLSMSSTGTSAEAGVICRVLKSVTGLSATTETGNCSVGQALTSYMINASSTSGGGMFGMGTVATINPLLSLKTMGDYCLVLGDAFQSAPWLIGAGGWLADKLGLATEAVGAVTGQAEVAAAGKGLSAAGQAATKLSTLALPMIVLGVLLSVYVPLVPFISWFSALINYATITVESVAASPLWGFAHLDANGEGMGARTQHGYLFLLNVLLRPALMVISFVTASAIIIIMGSLLYAAYGAAMANAQGDSITGLYSIIGYLAIFLVLNLTLVQGAMALIWVIPDNILNWLGSIGQSQLGKEAENKIYAMFLGAAASTSKLFGGPAAQLGGAVGAAEAAKQSPASKGGKR